MGNTPHYASHGAVAAESSVRTMDAIRSLMRELHVSSRRLEKATGASLAQLFALEAIAERPSESVTELASRLLSHQSSVSVVLRNLKQKGLIQRPRTTTRDRRVRAFVATAKGLDLLRHSPPTPQARLISAFATLTAAERRALGDVLDKWRRAAGLSTDRLLIGEDR